MTPAAPNPAAPNARGNAQPRRAGQGGTYYTY